MSEKKYSRPDFHPSQLNDWGRPREFDRVKIANELIEWAELDSSINLCEFCADQRINPETMLKWVKSDKDFLQAYEQARTRLGERRERKLSEQTLHVKAYDLNATTYDAFLRQNKRDDIEHEAAVKAKQNSAYTEEDIKRAQQVLDWVTRQQSENNDLSK